MADAAPFDIHEFAQRTRAKLTLPIDPLYARKGGEGYRSKTDVAETFERYRALQAQQGPARVTRLTQVVG